MIEPRRRLIHFLRRAHLYLGLFLMPWAVLYGLTGVMFNHPSLFADHDVRRFGPGVTAGTPIEPWPAPADLAGEVVKALQDAGVTSARLVEPERAGFKRDELVFGTKADGQSHFVVFDLPDPRSGVVRSSPASVPVERPPFEGKKLAVDGTFLERAKEAVPEVMRRQGLEAGPVNLIGVPDLSFLVEADDRTWAVSYSPHRGTVSGRPAEVPGQEVSSRRFALLLHTAHGYPARGGAKWWWVLFADVLGLAMVFWGLTGLLMWWQIRAVRLAGAVVILASLSAAILLTLAMHRAVTQ